MGPQDEAAQGGGNGANPLQQMVIETDQALTKLAQVFGQKIPEAGEALAQVNEQFRRIIEGVMAQASGGGQRRPDATAPSEAGGNPNAQQAL